MEKTQNQQNQSNFKEEPKLIIVPMQQVFEGVYICPRNCGIILDNLFVFPIINKDGEPDPHQIPFKIIASDDEYKILPQQKSMTNKYVLLCQKVIKGITRMVEIVNAKEGDVKDESETELGY